MIFHKEVYKVTLYLLYWCKDQLSKVIGTLHIPHFHIFGWGVVNKEYFRLVYKSCITYSSHKTLIMLISLLLEGVGGGGGKHSFITGGGGGTSIGTLYIPYLAILGRGRAVS
jgi:hypothetical protein